MIGGFWGLLIGILLAVVLITNELVTTCAVGLLVVMLPTGLGAFIAARAKPTDLGLCNDCGYDLRGSSSSRCPECGTELTILQRFRARRR